MNFWFVRFLLTLAFTEQTWSLPLVCIHNGTSYKEGESVKTNEPCLSCTCQRGSLNCNLRICADAPYVPAPGCLVVHEADNCCPTLLCEKKDTGNGVEVRTAFKTNNATIDGECVKNGSVYAEGSAVGSSGLCEYCYCIRGEIKCVRPRCLMPLEGCEPVYKSSSCCPTHYDCRSGSVGISTTEEENYGCKTNDIFYHEGQMVSSAGYPKCEKCYCMKGKVHCTPIICQIEPLFKQCQPLNIDEQCCPTSFSCDFNLKNSQEETSVRAQTKEVQFETTTSEFIPEENTILSEVNSTTIVALGLEEIASHPGLQTTQQDLENEDITKLAVSETTGSFESVSQTSPSLDFVIEKATSRVLTDFNIENRADTIFDETLGNSSNRMDDYDNYDYTEPTLPPSLPNLVIFPFVAADAVVKDETQSTSDIFNPSAFKNTNSTPPFNMNLFSPPLKTEGGFVPKDPQDIIKPSDEYDGKNINLSVVDTDTKMIPVSFGIPQQNNDSHFFIELLAAQRPLVTRFINPNDTLDPFEDVIKAEPAPDLSITTDSTTLQLTQTKTKPVTVTYKNVVVDYYPDFLVTSSRDKVHIKTDFGSVTENGIWKSSTPSEEYATTSRGFSDFLKANQTIATVVTPTKIAYIDLSASEDSTKDYATKSTKSITRVETIDKSSFLTDLLKSLLEGSVKPTTIPTTVIAKFSSHYLPFDQFSSSTPSVYSTIFGSSIPKTTKTSLVDTKPSEWTQQSSTSRPSNEITSTERIGIESSEKYNKQEKLAYKSNSENKKTNLEILLKLAGCNIYGRMYRVGKIIAELSGPCLECVCTNLGVQCSPLSC